MTGSGLLGMMIGLGIIVGLHPGMSLLPLHHQHFKRVRTKLRLYTVTELPSSSTSGSGAKVSAVTSGPPPGLDRTSNSQGNTSRSKSLLMAAITLGTFGVGNSVLVGPVVTPTSQGCSNLYPTSPCSLNESDHFETLQTVGLNHVKLPHFEDVFIDQHLTVAPTVDTSWIFSIVVQQPTAVPRTSPQNGHFCQSPEQNPHFVA